MAEQGKYIFKINEVMPHQLSAERLGEYIQALASLLGEKASVHFEKVTEGSTAISLYADAPARATVSERVQKSQLDGAAKSLRNAYQKLDSMLEGDGFSAGLTDVRANNVVQFTGAKKMKHQVIGPIKQPTSIEGQLIGLNGVDDSKHAHLLTRHGKQANLSMTEELAVQLKNYLFAPNIIRLNGEGSWLRNQLGIWTLEAMKVTSYQELVGSDLEALFDNIRALDLGWKNDPDPMATIKNMRED